MTGRVSGKVALVTGSTWVDLGLNIGGATALALAKEGAKVVCADLDLPGAKRLAAEINRSGGEAIATHLDVCEEESVAAAVDAAASTFGGLDILHNNVGAPHPDDGRVAELREDVFDWAVAVNARSAVFGCKHAIPKMVERGGGSIINTSSGVAAAGGTSMSAYAIAKASIHILTEYVATQHGRDRIRCNTVVPGMVLSSKALSHRNPDIDEMMLRHTLLPRLGVPEDLAHAVLFFASDESSWVTGQILAVNGGLDSHRPFYGDPASSIQRVVAAPGSTLRGAHGESTP